MARGKKSKATEVHAKPMENIYVAVDACGQLGGQPYKVLEALHDVYAITGRRKLTVVDTEQGYHEKADGTTPEILKALGPLATGFGRFLDDNAAWAEVVQTATCRKFRRALADTVFPQMVEPVVAVTEEISRRIRDNAFGILSKRGQTTLMGKHIGSPKDIDLQVDIFIPNEGGRSHYVFRNDVLSEAADGVMPFWRDKMREDPSLERGNKKKDEKGHMAAMVRSLQEVKAYTHTLMRQFHPALADEMGPTPGPVASNGKPTLATLRDSSHLYGQMPFPASVKLGEMPEMVQAVRLTTLWPWARKGLLSTVSAGTLDTIHKNTADVSYLDFFANELPKKADPSNTLFILLTHDGPLRNEFLEVSTGVEHTKERRKSDKKKEGGMKRDVFYESDIHERFGLTKRKPEEYPREAPWVGSEFVEFGYKEVLAALGPFIPNRDRRELLELIKDNKPTNDIDVCPPMMRAIKEAEGVPFDLRQALSHMTQEVSNLEMYVNRDIQAYGLASKEGNYYKQKVKRLEQLEEGKVKTRE